MFPLSLCLVEPAKVRQGDQRHQSFSCGMFSPYTHIQKATLSVMVLGARTLAGYVCVLVISARKLCWRYSAPPTEKEATTSALAIRFPKLQGCVLEPLTVAKSKAACSAS